MDSTLLFSDVILIKLSHSNLILKLEVPAGVAPRISRFDFFAPSSRIFFFVLIAVSRIFFMSPKKALRSTQN